MSPVDSLPNPFVVVYGFLLSNGYWFLPVLFFILSIKLKNKRAKIIGVALNGILGVYYIATAPNYAGGGGYGDMFMVLVGIIVLFLGLIQSIIVYRQIAKQVETERAENIQK